MSQLTDNLSAIAAIKSDIAAAIESKGVSMSGVSFGSYADKIGEIQTGGTFVTEPLSVSVNGVYNPGQGVDGFSQVIVDVPQSVTGFTEKEMTEKTFIITNLNNSASYVASGAFQNTNTLQTVNLPNVYSVYSYAFQSCRSLSSVNLPICEYVGNTAFMSCISLSYINIPNLKYAETGAFSDTALSFVSLPEYVGGSNYSYVADGVFNGCGSLKSVYLPKLKYIGANYFLNTLISELVLPDCYNVSWAACNGMKSLQIASFPKCGIISGNALAGCSMLSTLYIATEVYLKSVHTTPGITSDIESIYTHITNVSILASFWSSLSGKIVGIGDPNEYMLSFSNNTVSGITSGLFINFSVVLGINDSDIQHVYLPNCTFFENGWDERGPLFEKRSLLTVDLPVFVSLPNKAFYNCNSLSSVSLPLCEYVGSSGFRGCGSLSSIYLPECKYIGTEAFNGCNKLLDVSLPKCEYIGFFAIANCTSLVSINLPVCSYIGERCFQWDASLREITLGWSGVCEIGNNAFGNTGLSSIYVPSSLVDAYKSAAGWTSYSNRIFPIPE